MGKRNRKRVKKMKCINKAARNERNSETTSPRNTDVKMDGKKLSNECRGSDKIQGPGNFPQIMTEETNVNESRNLSTADDVAKQSSELKESDMVDEEIKDVLYAIDASFREFELKYMAGKISFLHYTFVSTALAQKYEGLSKLLESRNPPLAENTEQHAISKGKESIPNLSNTTESSKEISEAEKSPMSKVIGGTDKETTDSKFANVEDYVDGMITDLGNGLGKHMRLNDVDISIEDHQKAASSTQLLINETNDKKYGEEYTGNTQKPENSLFNNLYLECDEEMLNKIENITGVTVPEVKDNLKLNDINKTVTVCPTQKTAEEKHFAELYLFLKAYVDTLLTKSYINEAVERKNSNAIIYILSKRYFVFKKSSLDKNPITVDLKETKEREDKINGIVEGLKIFQRRFRQNENEGKNEGKNVNESNRSNPLQFYQNATEGKNGNYSNRSNGNIQDFHSRKELMTDMRQVEGCERKDEDKTVDPKKRDQKADFKRDLKEFMKFQNSKIVDRVKEYRDMVSDVKTTIERPGHISEKGPLTDEAETKSHEKTDDTTEFEENIEGNGASAEQNEPKVIVIELDKNEEIRFHIETDGKQRVMTHGYLFCFENKTHMFNFKKKSIQVSFSDYQIFISTQKSEFDISIRNDIRYLKEKSNPFNLADEAAQTESL